MPSGQWVAHLSFLFRGSKPPESKTRLNGSKPPPGTQRHQNNAMQTQGKSFYSNWFLHVAFRVIFEAFLYVVL